MAHKQITDKAGFESAINGSSKDFVFIYIYEGGDMPAQAEDMAKKNADKVDSYKVDVSSHPQAKDFHGVSSLPAAVLYKGGKEIKKVEGMDPAGMKEIGQLLSA